MEKRVKELEEKVSTLTQAFDHLQSKLNMKVDKHKLLDLMKDKELVRIDEGTFNAKSFDIVNSSH